MFVFFISSFFTFLFQLYCTCLVNLCNVKLKQKCKHRYNEQEDNNSIKYVPTTMHQVRSCHQHFSVIIIFIDIFFFYPHFNKRRRYTFLNSYFKIRFRNRSCLYYALPFIVNNFNQTQININFCFLFISPPVCFHYYFLLLLFNKFPDNISERKT